MHYVHIKFHTHTQIPTIKIKPKLRKWLKLKWSFCLNSGRRNAELYTCQLNFRCRHQLSNGTLQASEELHNLNFILHVCPVPVSKIQTDTCSSSNLHQNETNCTVKMLNKMPLKLRLLNMCTKAWAENLQKPLDVKL